MNQLVDPAFWAFVGVTAGIYAVFALGLQVEFGLAGLLNFGHIASMALSAYTMAILVVKFGVNLVAASAAAIAVAVLGSLILGFTAVRLRSDYFAIVTIAFSEIVRYVALNQQSWTGGDQGTTALAGVGQAAYYNTQWDALILHVRDLLRATVGEGAATRDVAMLLIVWLVGLVLLGLTWRASRSPWGRALRSIRDDEDAAEALGKATFRLKLQALAVGSAIAGVAGLLYAFQFSFFSPQDFEPLTTFFAYTIILLGGTGRIWAVPIGAAVFGFLYAGTRFFDFPPFSLMDSADRAYVRLIIIGLVLIGLMYFRPQGLLGRREEMAT
jgi:ABC-type branched-subunit amino acid transport system permease subunit